jgi:uracil-DNA glycosylase family 4
MRWSGSLADDLRRRYLAQQAELGGNEVILPGTIVPPAVEDTDVTAKKAGRGRAVESGAPAKPHGDKLGKARPAKSQKSSGGKSWRDGAPAIPGPGLEVVTDDVLLENEFRELPTLQAVADMIAGCPRCSLAESRTRTVPGEGNPKAKLMLVGEGPGATEDQTGRPFVGQAGQLLDKILESIGMPRETVFIANIVKCRPPQNRKPLPDEIAACLPYLRRQIELVKPDVIMALGGTAAEGLLGVKKGLGELRNKVHRYNGIPLIVTYHPAALLRNPNWKKPTWDDVRIARQLLDR